MEAQPEWVKDFVASGKAAIATADKFWPQDAPHDLQGALAKAGITLDIWHPLFDLSIFYGGFSPPLKQTLRELIEIPELIKCPKCGSDHPNDVLVVFRRDDVGDLEQIGWYCRLCDHQWS